jgi:hypothetical protein
MKYQKQPNATEEMPIVTVQKLAYLSNIYSIWYFNNYLRVTYVARCWLVVWDHRVRPPERYDFKRTNSDHQTVCRLAADQLHKLAPHDRGQLSVMPGL